MKHIPKGMKFYPPDTIQILAPRPVTTARGRNANKPEDPIRTIRISQAWWETYKEAASILGMPAAEFIRWCAYATANEIMRLADKAGVVLEVDPNNNMLPSNGKPRYAKVLVVDKGGAEISKMDVVPAFTRPKTVPQIDHTQAKSLDTITAFGLQTKKSIY